MGQPEESSDWRWHLTLIAAVAALFRVPIWITRINQTFDEGVFLASNDLVAHGLVPFRDFFSSQGPLFLPLLRAAQIVSLDDPRGARTLMVLAGILMSISFYYIARAYTAPTRALAFALVLATSGVGILAAGPIQSDGLAFSLALAALAVVVSKPLRWTAPVAGLLLGAAVAVKSLQVLPVVVLVVTVYVAWRMWGQLLATGLVALTTLVTVSIPFGIDRVWDQFVLFHLAKDNTLSVGDNMREGIQKLWNLDGPTIALLVVIVSFALVNRNRLPKRSPATAPTWLPWVWLAMTMPLIGLFTPIAGGFARALIVVIPPILLLLAVVDRTPIRLLIGLAAFALLWQPLGVDLIGGRSASPEDIAIIDQISDVAADRTGVSDEPGLLWAAGVLSSPATVDPAFARFVTGYLTNADVEAALESDQACLLIAISGRFEIAALTLPTDYRPTNSIGLFRRIDC